jgi:plastocyanin
MKKFWIGAGLAAALTLAGCGGDEKKAEAPKTESAAAPAAAGGGAGVPDEANGGTVTGKVSFDGAKPTAKNIDMSANPVCMRAHSTAQASEEVVINGNNTVKYAFVWVKSGLPDKNWQTPTAPVVLDQEGCMYKPHVIGVMTGQPIDIKNADPTNHNIHPLPQVNQEWNESQPPGSADKMQSFPRQEVLIPVKCNIHPWMRAYIGVVSHPFFAVTGDDGTYTLKGLPPGTYTIEIVHEKYGKQEQQVTVGAKESKTADFTIKG